MVSIRKAKQGFQVRKRGGVGGPGGVMAAVVGGATGVGGGGGGKLSQTDKEKLGVQIMMGLCLTVLLLVVFFLLPPLSGSHLDYSENGLAPGGSGANGFNGFRKPHPNLVIPDDEEDKDPPNKKHDTTLADVAAAALNRNNVNGQRPPRNKSKNDKFNAIALDIINTLDCDNIMAKAAKQMPGSGHRRGNSGDANDKEFPQQHERRLMDQHQHGDDGGFGKDNIEEAAKEMTETDDQATEEDSQEEKWGRAAVGNAPKRAWDDYRPADADAATSSDSEEGGMYEDDEYKEYVPKLTAEHLFCLAAMESPPPAIVNAFKCEASTHRRRTLLDLWSAARSQILDNELLKKILHLAQERSSQYLLQRIYNLWSPPGDTGFSYATSTLNKDQKEALTMLKSSLGENKLFVDVGSGMGLTTLAVSQLYPLTKIVSIEPASPNWLMQQLNLRCNLEKKELSKIKVVLAGLGPNTDEEDDMMAKLMWRASSTTSTRSWTPANEFGADDIELVVRLRKLKSILAEADIYVSSPNMMDVLNLDCQGCEYNFIPSLTDEEFDAIPNVMGNVHWGYIPVSKLPSSHRGRQTHERLCQHENIAKTTKECCSFLDTPVKSNVPGEVLYRDKGGNKPAEAVSVSDVIREDLCLDYEKWSKDHYVDNVPDDFGWFELSSKA
jgi:FkbM family methyltransferase